MLLKAVVVTTAAAVFTFLGLFVCLFVCLFVRVEIYPGSRRNFDNVIINPVGFTG